MLTVLLRKVKIARFLHRVPPLDDMLSFVTQRETSCQDPLFPVPLPAFQTCPVLILLGILRGLGNFDGVDGH